MGFMWYCIINAHCKGWSELWLLAENGFDAGEAIPKDKTLGLVEKLSTGEWLCYTMLLEPQIYVGFERSMECAKVRVIDEIKKEVRASLVLACKPVKQPGQKGAGVPDPGQGDDEQSADRIQGRVQGDSKPECHQKNAVKSHITSLNEAFDGIKPYLTEALTRDEENRVLWILNTLFNEGYNRLAEVNLR